MVGRRRDIFNKHKREGLETAINMTVAVAVNKIIKQWTLKVKLFVPLWVKISSSIRQ